MCYNVIRGDKMKYKVGDKVRVKSLDWFRENCEYNEIHKCFIYKEEVVVFPKSTQRFCGQVVTICGIVDDVPPYYVIEDENKWRWIFVDWMLEEIGDENEV